MYLLRLLFISQNGMRSLFSGHLLFQGFIANARASGVSVLAAGLYGGIITTVICSVHIMGFHVHMGFHVLVRISISTGFSCAGHPA